MSMIFLSKWSFIIHSNALAVAFLPPLGLISLFFVIVTFYWWSCFIGKKYCTLEFHNFTAGTVINISLNIRFKKLHYTQLAFFVILQPSLKDSWRFDIIFSSLFIAVFTSGIGVRLLETLSNDSEFITFSLSRFSFFCPMKLLISFSFPVWVFDCGKALKRTSTSKL